jgi:hypothetical protein
MKCSECCPHVLCTSTFLYVLGWSLDAIEQGVEAAKTSHADAKETRKKQQAAEKKHLIKVAVAEATRAVDVFKQRLESSGNMSGTTIDRQDTVLHLSFACVQIKAD